MQRVIYTAVVFIFHLYNSYLLFYPMILFIYSLLCVLFIVILDNNHRIGYIVRLLNYQMRGGTIND